MDYRILGPLEVRVDGEVVDLGPRKQRALFALLLINHNRTVSTDRILEALWGDDAEGKENALWVYISRLRSILGDATQDEVLVTKDHGYSVEIDSHSLDAERFQVLASEGRSVILTDPAAAAEDLASSLELWRGNPLEDFAYEEFAQAEINRLTALRAEALDDLVEARLATGAAGELISELEQTATDRPFDEKPVRQLMLALYRSGRQTEALRTYERFRRHLAEEVGTEPSPELALLEEQVLFHDSRLGAAGTTDSGNQPNPYRGLEPFLEEDAAVFFGRDRLVAELLSRIDDQPIVTLIGPSGSGKSSVVRSGVVPAIRKGALEGSDQWQVATMIPGSHPFVELEAALLRSRLDTPDSLRGQLDGEPDEILRAVRRVTPTDHGTVLIVIDQFEELFTSTDPATSKRFLTAVVEALADTRGRARFLITLRADFYDRVLLHPSFGTSMAQGIVNVVPMAPEELEAAAAGPAQGVGVRLEPALMAALIGDVLAEPGALPLFQFALTDLFDRRVGDTLTLDTYRSMGGIEGSITRKAEHLYGRLDADQKGAARQVFLRLVTVTDGTANSRRRVEASELLSLDLDPDDVRVVLDSFGKERLLSFDRSQTTGSPTVEVAHEALLSQWSRLAEWISDAREDVTRNMRLNALSEEWRDADRDETLLLTGGRYESYAQWAETSTMVLAKDEREFLEASRAAHQETQEEESERAAREQAAARRARRSGWSLVAVVGAVIVVGLVGVWLALRPAGPTVAWVHRAGDDSVIATMRATGFDAASRTLPIEFVDIPVTNDPQGTLRKVAEEGADLIMVPFPDAPRGSLADDYPNTDFIVMDSNWRFEADNVFTTAFDEPQGAYLMGVAAAEASESNRIGFIGGWQHQLFESWIAAYEQGAKSVNPDVEVLVSWLYEDGTAAWADRDAAALAATSLFLRDVDVVFTAAGESGVGAAQAAHDYSEWNSKQVWAIGVDSDEGYLAEAGIAPYVLTSMVKEFGGAIEVSIERWLSGELAKVTTFDLENDGIGYSKVNPRFDPTGVQLAEQEIIAGRIVPDTVTAIPTTWRTRANVSVPVTLDDSGCETPVDILAFEAIADFDLINETDRDAVFLIAALDQATTREQLEESMNAIGDDFPALEDRGLLYTNHWTVPSQARYTMRWHSEAIDVGTQAVVVVCDAFSDTPVFSDVIEVLALFTPGDN